MIALSSQNLNIKKLCSTSRFETKSCGAKIVQLNKAKIKQLIQPNNNQPITLI